MILIITKTLIKKLLNFRTVLAFNYENIINKNINGLPILYKSMFEHLKVQILIQGMHYFLAREHSIL